MHLPGSFHSRFKAEQLINGICALPCGSPSSDSSLTPGAPYGDQRIEINRKQSATEDQLRTLLRMKLRESWASTPVWRNTVHDTSIVSFRSFITTVAVLN